MHTTRKRHATKNHWRPLTRGMILVVWCLLLAGSSMAQPESMRQLKASEPVGYRIEGDEVVFEFDKRDYDQVTHERFKGFRDLEDIDVREVGLAGEFNGWSGRGWKMHRVDENRFQLRKKISDFEGKLEWQYKYVINGKLWSEPPHEAPNVVESDVPNRRNLKLVVAEPSLKGNTTFRLKLRQAAQRVFLAGEFNDWRPEELLMSRIDGEWICRIDLSPGRYEYKFIVDGKWITDPANPALVADGPYLNSVRVVE